VPPRKRKDDDSPQETVAEPSPESPKGTVDIAPDQDEPVTVEEMTTAETNHAEVRWEIGRLRALVDMMAATDPTVQRRLSALAVPQPGAIFGAVWEVMKSVQGVGKHGQMDPAARMGNYKYRKYDDLKRELGAACRVHGVALQSTIHNVINEQRGNMQRVQVHITYRFTSLVDGSEMRFDSLGESQDRSDKATGKAMTMALKSAMDQAFMLAAEDIEDPDDTRPEPDPYGNGTMVPNDRWGANQRGPLANTPERVMREASQRERAGQVIGTDNGPRRYAEGDPVPAGGHQVGDQREVAGMTFTKHSDGPGYPNDAPKDPANPWDNGPVEDRRTPQEKAQAAADKLSASSITLDRWTAISQAARAMELLDVPVRTPNGDELPLKHYMAAVGRTL